MAIFIVCGWDRGGVWYSSDYSLDESGLGAVSYQGLFRFVVVIARQLGLRGLIKSSRNVARFDGSGGGAKGRNDVVGDIGSPASLQDNDRSAPPPKS